MGLWKIFQNEMFKHFCFVDGILNSLIFGIFRNYRRSLRDEYYFLWVNQMHILRLYFIDLLD